MSLNEKTGIVMSVAGKQSITVRVESLHPHGKFGKYLRHSKNFMAHDAQGGGDPPGGVQFDGVALAVGDGQRVEFEALGLRNRGGRAGVQAPAQEHDRFSRRLTRRVHGPPR